MDNWARDVDEIQLWGGGHIAIITMGQVNWGEVCQTIHECQSCTISKGKSLSEWLKIIKGGGDTIIKF